MKRFISTTIVCWACVLAVTASQQRRPDDPRFVEPGQIAPLLKGLGEHDHAVTTQSDRAQVFFDQGLRLAYVFNHREADRAFREAARLDPECAMAYWGRALVNGPNLNLPMDEAAGRVAYASIQKALELKPKVSIKERDFIEALATRYASDPGAARGPLNRAYVAAMKKLAQKYPQDEEASTLYGAALMNISPWDYWRNDGRPYERTREAMEVFKSVLHTNPKHPGAHHYYIHVVEAHHPEWALPSARALEGLMPGAGHIVHMPSHIYMRTGRYEEAYQANLRAIAADESYITQCRAQGIYPLAYYPHNLHFLWYASTEQGRSKEAVEAARKVASKIPENVLKDTPSFQTFFVVPYYALTRFGKWEEILQVQEPGEDLLFARAIRCYARGNALRALGRLDEAEGELKKLKVLAADKRLKAQMWISAPADILEIAIQTLAGEIAARHRDFDGAIAHLDRAVRLQDALAYNEPPDWYYPVRQSLGAVLIEAGRIKEAEVVYWEDLRRNPANGWSLFGLAQSLRAQGKVELASEVEQQFQEVWRNADVKLSSSRF